MRIRDPRGKVRKIVKIEEQPTITLITKDCGHCTGYAQHFTYKVGTSIHCYECKDYHPVNSAETKREIIDIMMTNVFPEAWDRRIHWDTIQYFHHRLFFKLNP